MKGHVRSEVFNDVHMTWEVLPTEGKELRYFISVGGPTLGSIQPL